MLALVNGRGAVTAGVGHSLPDPHGVAFPPPFPEEKTETQRG